MRYIIIGIIVIYILGHLIAAIAPFLIFILAIAAIGAVAYAYTYYVFILYRGAGCPVSIIALLLLALLIANIIFFIRRLIWKHKFISLLNEGIIEAELINQDIEHFEDRVTEGCQQILPTINKMAMGTDKEIYQKIDFPLINEVNELNERIKLLDRKLTKQYKYSLLPTGISTIDKVSSKIIKEDDIIKKFQEQLSALLEKNKIEIATSLNQKNNNVEAWNEFLYRSLHPDEEPDCMLPPQYLEID